MKKLCIIIGFSSVITLGLFAFMAFLVKNEQPNISKPLPYIPVDVAQTPKMSKAQPKPPKLIPPEVPKVQPPLPRAQVESATKNG